MEGRSTPYNTTHMTPMEVAYESGIFAGVFYLLVNLISGILTIMYAWRQREEKFALLPLMVVLAFGIISYTTSVHSSFNYMLTFYYYLIIFPVIAKGRKEPDKSVR